MKFCSHNSLLHVNEESLCEWKVIFAKGLCSRVSLLSHLFEATFAWIRSCFPTGCSADATGNISPNRRISLFYSRVVFFFFAWLCFCFKFQVWKGAKVYYIAFFTCGSLLHTLLTAKWITGEEMQLPWCCTRGKSGRAFRVEHFVQPTTLPSQFCYT